MGDDDRTRSPDWPGPSGPDGRRREPAAKAERGPAYAATERIAGRPPIAAWLMVGAISLAVVVAQPWTELTDEASPTPPSSSRATVATLAPADPPTAVVGVDQPAPGCIAGTTWLVASIEQSRGAIIRIWRALEPATAATGPLDGAIPSLHLRSESVRELGWCAPTAGPAAPAVASSGSIEAWRLVRSSAVRVSLGDPRPTAPTDASGGLYPPVRPQETGWQDGRYVFHYRNGDAFDRWFAIALETRPVVN